MEREVCGTCNNPVWLCHSYDNRIEFMAKTGMCYGAAAIDEKEKDPSTPKLDPGEFYYAVAVGIENDDGTFDPLPSRLEAMQKIT